MNKMVQSSSNPPLLGVNIDHVATLRQARGVNYPDPIEAALLCEQAGADGITLHLREDRRHILDEDVYRMKPLLKTRMNLEMATTEEMLNIAASKLQTVKDKYSENGMLNPKVLTCNPNILKYQIQFGF